MSFEEKSTWVVLGALLIAYGQYFLDLSAQTPWLLESTVDIEYRMQMLGTVMALVAIIVAAHIVIAIFAPSESDQADERDREINLRGEHFGGYVLGFATLAAMGLAMFEQEHFWIANLLLLGLVLSEIVSNSIKLVIYRRGF